MREMILEENGIKAFIFQRENNYYYAYLTDNSKRFRKSLKTKDRLKALRYCFNTVDEYRNGITKTPSFKKVAQEFLKTVLDVKKKQTYEARLKQVFYKPFGKKRINDLTEHLINDYIYKRLKTVKPQTVNRDTSVLLQVLKYAKKMSYIKALPTPEHLKEEKRRRNAFTDNEIQELFETSYQTIIETKNQKTKFDRIILNHYIRFLYETGLRTGEASSIKFSGVSNDIAKLTSSKTKIREVYLSPEAQNIIKSLKQTYNDYNVFMNDESYVFINYHGQPIKSFKKSFKELLGRTSMSEMVGLNSYTLYSFRHTWVSNAIKRNVPLTTIALQCGTSIEMIQKNYNHLTIHCIKDGLIK